jgi:hypothetical protein
LIFILQKCVLSQQTNLSLFFVFIITNTHTSLETCSFWGNFFHFCIGIMCIIIISYHPLNCVVCPANNTRVFCVNIFKPYCVWDWDGGGKDRVKLDEKENLMGNTFRSVLSSPKHTHNLFLLFLPTWVFMSDVRVLRCCLGVTLEENSRWTSLGRNTRVP